MRRIIYCPNNDLIQEASDLSNKTFLPIQVGDSANTESLDFSRQHIGIISIPQYNNATHKTNINLGFHQIIDYRNDFVIFDNSLKLVINNIDIFPTIMEHHYSKFLYKCDTRGDFVATIWYKEKILERLKFYVH